MKSAGVVALLREPQGAFELNRHMVPVPDEGSLLLRIELCGICGTDVHIYNGKHGAVGFPIVLGHEIVGVVEDGGVENPVDYLNQPVSPGDRVILTPAMYCGSCFFCSVANTPSRCVAPEQYGFYSRNEANSPFNGGYGQYLVMDYAKTDFFRTDVSAEAGVFAEPLAVSFHSTTRAGVLPGDTVVVQGAGSLGLLHVLAAKIAGAQRIIVVTRRKTAKLEVARELGADVTITMEETPDEADRVRMVKEASIHGFGADAVFECVGVPGVIPEGIAYVRDSGVYCIVGHAVDEGTATVNPADIMDRNLRIEGVFDHTVEDFYKAAVTLEREHHGVERILSHTVPIDRLKEAFERLRTRTPFEGSEIAKAAVQPW